MASTVHSTGTTQGSKTTGLDRLEGRVVSVGGVTRPNEVNDLNHVRAEAATEALALYMELKGQKRKLDDSAWSYLQERLHAAETARTELIEQVSIHFEVCQSTGETIRVQVTGAEAELVTENINVGDRIEVEGVAGEQEFLLETYDVFKRSTGSEERPSAPYPVSATDGHEDAQTPKDGEQEGSPADEATV